jgi:lipoprotein-releasing system permease protein
MILKLAWRNILRNLRRSIVTVLLSVICTGFLIWGQALNDGGHHKMIADSVEIYSGYLQIHGVGFQENPNYDNLIFDLDDVQNRIKDIKEIKAASPRLETFALFTADADSVGGMLVGIKPSSEEKISRIKRGLIKGKYLSDNDTNAVYLGADLAERLEVGLGDEIIFLSSAVDYSMAAAKLKITGIFKTNLFDFDARTAFINKSFMDEEFLADNIASHYVILPENKDKAIKLQKEIEKVLDKKTHEVVSWKTTMKAMVQFVAVDDAFGALTWGILVLIIFFVVMIFSLISIFQRTREIGIMRAIGTSQKQIFKILFTEGLILAIAGVVIGGSLGIGLARYFELNPIVFNFEPEVMELYRQYGMVDMVMPARLGWYPVLLGIVPVFLLNILAIIYPAWKVNSLKPIDAIEER